MFFVLFCFFNQNGCEFLFCFLCYFNQNEVNIFSIHYQSQCWRHLLMQLLTMLRFLYKRLKWSTKSECLLNLKDDNKILFGDWNVEMKNKFMNNFVMKTVLKRWYFNQLILNHQKNHRQLTTFWLIVNNNLSKLLF